MTGGIRARQCDFQEEVSPEVAASSRRLSRCDECVNNEID